METKGLVKKITCYEMCCLKIFGLRNVHNVAAVCFFFFETTNCVFKDSVIRVEYSCPGLNCSYIEELTPI